eukprot:2681106-Alexandrium_andersonii.AAC.1
MAAQYCRGGARTARTSRRMQRSTRPRCARRSFAGSRPSMPVKDARFPGTCRTGWAAALLCST